MPPPSFLLRIPQPCPESWDAMTPTGPGRHCTACQKTVVDFTQKTDAEILAYLARVAGDTCGRFGNDQLNRPLLPAPVARPASRWRTWVALAVAMWGLRASPAATGAPLAGRPGTVHPPKKAGAKPTFHAPKLLHGTVRDADTHEPLAGVAVFLKGENQSATTDSAGHFRLRLPANRPRAGRALVLHYAGYQSATVPMAAVSPAAMQLALRADPAAAGATIVGYSPAVQHREVTGGAVVTFIERPAPKPWPWHPRSFWRLLTQPFRQ